MQNKNIYIWSIIILILVAIFVFFFAPTTVGNISYKNQENLGKIENNDNGDVLGEEKKVELPPLDIDAYNAKILALANNPILPVPEPKYDPETGELIPPPTPQANSVA